MKNYLGKRIEKQFAKLKSMGVKLTNLDEPLYPGLSFQMRDIYDPISLALLTHPVRITANPDCFLNLATLHDLYRQFTKIGDWPTEAGGFAPRNRVVSWGKLFRFFNQTRYNSAFIRTLFPILALHNIEAHHPLQQGLWIVDEDFQKELYSRLCEIESKALSPSSNLLAHLSELKYRAVHAITVSFNPIFMLRHPLAFLEGMRPTAFEYYEQFEYEAQKKEDKLLANLRRFEDPLDMCLRHQNLYMYFIVTIVGLFLEMSLIGYLFYSLRNISHDNTKNENTDFFCLYQEQLYEVESFAAWIVSMLHFYFMYYVVYLPRNHDLFNLKNNSVSESVRRYEWGDAPDAQDEKRLAYSNMHSLFKLRKIPNPDFKNVDDMREGFKCLRQIENKKIYLP